MKKKLLITGACGVTSRSFLRGLKLSKIFNEFDIIGTDIFDNYYGIFEGLYQKVYKVPNWNHKDYKKIMLEIIKKEKIDLMVVIPELEVLFWSQQKNIPTKTLLPPPRFSKIAISKRKLYEALKQTDLIPKFVIANKTEIKNLHLEYPTWIRDYSEGSSSGAGSFLAKNKKEVLAWLTIKKNMKRFILSEYLPGKNYACSILFRNNKIIKYAQLERMEYFGAKISVSGITGNTCKSRMINNKKVLDQAFEAINNIANINNENLNCLLTVDLKEDNKKIPKVTEINLRHVALTSGFSMAGINLAEAHVFATLEQFSKIKNNIPELNKNNLYLRDIDGNPIWIKKFTNIKIGEFYKL